MASSTPCDVEVVKKQWGHVLFTKKFTQFRASPSEESETDGHLGKNQFPRHLQSIIGHANILVRGMTQM